MERPISLEQANRQRAIVTAGYLSRALGDVGPWNGYNPSEGLIGRLERPDSLGGSLTLSYHRPTNQDAQLVFGFVDMKDIVEQERDNAFVVKRDVTESFRWEVNFDDPIEYEEVVSHTFTKTRGWGEQAQQAWKVAAEASLGVEYAGIKAAAKISGEYGQQLSQQKSGSETESDTVSRTIRFKGPAHFAFEASRSLDHEEQLVRAVCDFDYKVYFMTPGGRSNIWEWTTYHSQFIPLAEGLLSDDIYGYDEFMANPLTDEEYEALTRKSDKVVAFVVSYDRVQTMHLDDHRLA